MNQRCQAKDVFSQCLLQQEAIIKALKLHVFLEYCMFGWLHILTLKSTTFWAKLCIFMFQSHKRKNRMAASLQLGKITGYLVTTLKIVTVGNQLRVIAATNWSPRGCVWDPTLDCTGHNYLEGNLTPSNWWVNTGLESTSYQMVLL